MKTKRILPVLIFLCVAFCLQAAPIDSTTAKQVALTFMQSRPGCAHLQAGDITLSFTSAQMGDSPENTFYAFNAGTHAFVIVSANNCAQPILAYSTTSSLQLSQMPPETRTFFTNFHSAVKELSQPAQNVSAATQASWDALLSGQPPMRTQSTAGVPPLIETKWDQSPYYNNYCPYDYELEQLAITGCTATGMAQIIRYWKYPRHGHGKCAYTHDKYGFLEVDYSKADYRFEDMPVKLDYLSNEKQIDAVARLMADCGIGVAMDYSPNASGAMVIQEIGGEYSAEYVLSNYFGYVYGEGVFKKAEPLTWQKRVKNDLDNGRPLLFAGYNNEIGHCFICDGYDDLGLFHFNFGWQGHCDGFYLMDSAYNFPRNQQAIFNLMPPNLLNKHHLVLYSQWDVSDDTLHCGEAFNVRINVLNNGNKPFFGEFRMILENSQSHAIVAVFDTLSCQENPLPGETSFNTPLVFHGYLEKLLTDNYNLRLQYRDTNAKEWLFVPRIGNFTNTKSVRFDGGNTTTCVDSLHGITAHSAAVTAHVKSACSETVIMKAIQYKKSGASSFTTVKDTSSGHGIHALLSNLEPATSYDIQSYVMVQADATYKTYTSEKTSFTTEKADGVRERTENNARIYPNPSTGMVRIEAKELQNSRIILFNPLGQKVLESRLNNGQAELQLDAMGKGVYFICMEKDGRKIVQKIVLE